MARLFHYKRGFIENPPIGDERRESVDKRQGEEIGSLSPKKAI
jgi:hypothetical protein